MMRKIDIPKWKAFADDKQNFTKLMKFGVKKDGKHFKKEENSGNQHIFYLVKDEFRHSDAEPHSSVGSVQDLRTGGRMFNTRAWPIFFPRIDDSHCDRILSYLTAVHSFDNGSGESSQWLERILCRVLVKKNPGKYGYIN